MVAASPIASGPVAQDARLTDSHGRVIHDLRVSVTDRCNYKCVYCRTGEVGAQYPELAIDEYLRLIRLFVDLGITKVRLTGGEPLLRRGLLDLVRELAGLRTLWRRPARTRADHQRPSARDAGAAAQGRRPGPRHREHGRGGRADLRAHHPRSGQLSNGAARHSRGPGRRPHSAQNQLRAAARLQRRPGGGLCPFRAAKKMWSSASSSSCRSKKAACGRRRSWSPCARSSSASAA